MFWDAQDKNKWGDKYGKNDYVPPMPGKVVGPGGGLSPIHR